MWQHAVMCFYIAMLTAVDGTHRVPRCPIAPAAQEQVCVHAWPADCREPTMIVVYPILAYDVAHEMQANMSFARGG